MNVPRIASAFLVCMACVHAEDADSIRNKLTGTWKLISYVREQIPSGIKSDAMGPHPSGYLTYGADGRMMAMVVGTDRHKPTDAVPTPKESEDLFRSLFSYTGTYTVQADKIIHHVDVSWNEAYTGTDQTRSYKLEGDRLTIATTPSLDAIVGSMSIRTLTWERVK